MYLSHSSPVQHRGTGLSFFFLMVPMGVENGGGVMNKDHLIIT